MRYYCSHLLNLKIKYPTACSVCHPTGTWLGCVRAPPRSCSESTYFCGESAIVWEAPAARKRGGAGVGGLRTASLARNLPSSWCFQWNVDKSTVLISGKCAAKIESFITRKKLVVLNLPNILAIILVPRREEFRDKIFTKSNRNGISLFFLYEINTVR